MAEYGSVRSVWCGPSVGMSERPKTPYRAAIECRLSEVSEADLALTRQVFDEFLMIAAVLRKAEWGY
jgi:hypothetical protein